MPKIPRLYKTQSINIEGNEIELKGYRLIDNEYIVPLQEARNQLRKKSIELNKIAEKYKEDEQVQAEDLEKMTQIADEIDQLKPEVEELNHRIAQRGLKRFYYPDIKETDEIDALEDIEIDPENEILITNIMLNIGTPTTPGKESGKGKQRKKSREEIFKGIRKTVIGIAERTGWTVEYILELDMQVVNDFMDDKTPASGAKKKADEINRNIRAAKEGKN